MIKVAIADDQVLLRDMLTMMLLQDEEISVVGCAGDGNQIVQLCANQRPDVVIMDIRMPEVGGIDALNVIKRRFPDIKVMMLTTFEDEASIQQAYNNGADGYVLKDIKPHVLVLAVKCIHEGLFIIHKSVHRFMTERVKANNHGKLAMCTTKNDELEFDRIDLSIMRSLAEGRNNREIAATLNFSEGTVKNRISRILSLTGFKDRTQIAVFALKNKLI